MNNVLTAVFSFCSAAESRSFCLESGMIHTIHFKINVYFSLKGSQLPYCVKTVKFDVYDNLLYIRRRCRETPEELEVDFSANFSLLARIYVIHQFGVSL